MLEPVRQALGWDENAINQMRNYLSQMLNLHGSEKHEVDFLIIYYLSDAIVARQFEGLKLDYDFNVL
jgi:hypothetical protein